MLRNTLEELLREEDQRDRHIKKLVQYGIGGSVVIALTVLGLKYEIVKNRIDLLGQIDNIQETVASQYEEQFTNYENRLRAAEERAEQSTIVLNPCVTRRNEQVYEVRGCSQ